jgi:hypothetical protein
MKDQGDRKLRAALTRIVLDVALGVALALASSLVIHQQQFQAASYKAVGTFYSAF